MFQPNPDSNIAAQRCRVIDGMSKILMVASEAAPFAKTGGLADVVGALPAALEEFGHETRVLLPRYRAVHKVPMRRVYDHLPVSLGGRSYDTSIYQADADERFLFIDCPPLFDRAGFYSDGANDYPDNDLRFGLLSRAALEVARRIFQPDLLHCHDWQAGLVPVYLKQYFSGDPTFLHVKTLSTIHNLGYQGIFGPGSLARLGLSAQLFRPDLLEFFGDISFLKAGLVFSDWLSTVSAKYAQEIQTPAYGFGLDGLLRARSASLTGIVNGVDYALWNPATDPLLAANYDETNLEGKLACKRQLIEQFGLDTRAVNKPLLGIVSRFTSQKGADLIAEAAEAIFAEDVYLVALGSGEPRYEEMFRALAQHFPGRVGLFLGYDESLAHRIEAGADIFLMPSQYEPCGLNQIYSLKYGTVPVVRATGGLDDTIDVHTGFKFQEYSAAALLGALRECLAAYRQPELWRALIRHGMCKDFSWKASARQYSALYSRILNLSEV